MPSKTIILGPKEPASKTMQKQELDSHGRETEGVYGQMDGYETRFLLIWHNTGASVSIPSTASSGEAYPQV